MTNKILLYEEFSINAHPALQTQVYDGWILRFANGYTGRANSIYPLYQSSLDLQEKINECEKRYSAQGLPTIFKLTDGSDMDIDKALAQRGYTIDIPTYVMDLDLQGANYSSDDFVITSYADDDWLNSFFIFKHYTDKKIMTTAKQIFKNVVNTMICGRIVKKGITVACGSAVIERGYMALMNIVVDESHRGKGYGKEICESLLAAAKRMGAHTSYLEVVHDNHKAVSMYKKLGYRIVYSYWNRVYIA